MFIHNESSKQYLKQVGTNNLTKFRERCGHFGVGRAWGSNGELLEGG